MQLCVLFVFLQRFRTGPPYLNLILSSLTMLSRYQLCTLVLNFLDKSEADVKSNKLNLQSLEEVKNRCTD